MYVTAVTILSTFQWALSVKLQLLAMEDDKVDQTILVKVSMEWLKQKAMVYCMFQCIDFVNFFAMITTYFIGQSIYGYHYILLSTEEFSYLVLEIPVYGLACGLVFYML